MRETAVLLVALVAMGACEAPPKDIYATDRNLAAQQAPPPPAPEPPPEGNPRFQVLKPFFREYLKRPGEAIPNVFLNHLGDFTPLPDLEVSSEEDTSNEPKTPLEYYDVDSYRLVLIMSGTAQAKALLVDPQEKSYIVQVGTRVGNRQGKVVLITSTELRIEEPGRPLVIKALESPLTDLEKELQAVQEY